MLNNKQIDEILYIANLLDELVVECSGKEKVSIEERKKIDYIVWRMYARLLES